MSIMSLRNHPAVLSARALLYSTEYGTPGRAALCGALIACDGHDAGDASPLLAGVFSAHCYLLTGVMLARRAS